MAAIKEAGRPGWANGVNDQRPVSEDFLSSEPI
jgi:hypothetical protein